MFKHILITTDGSRLSAKGIKAGVKLAAALGAKVAGVYVIPPFMPPMYGDISVYVPDLAPEEFTRMHEAAAKRALALVEIEAEAAGVEWSVAHPTAQHPWEGILKQARAKNCDAIVMASHGRGGLGGLVLGSETTRVLAHSKLPVVVVR